MHGLKNTCARYVAMALWAVEAMMEGVVALHAWQILMTIHELFTLWKLFSLLVTWECIFEAQKRLMNCHSCMQFSIANSCMHACICITSIMPFTERGSMVRLLADSHVPKVGFEFHTSPCNCKSTSHRR